MFFMFFKHLIILNAGSIFQTALIFNDKRATPQCPRCLCHIAYIVGNTHPNQVNWLAPERCGSNISIALFKPILRIYVSNISGEIDLTPVQQKLIDDESTLVQVMA